MYMLLTYKPMSKNVKDKILINLNKCIQMFTTVLFYEKAHLFSMSEVHKIKWYTY